MHGQQNVKIYHYCSTVSFYCVYTRTTQSIKLLTILFGTERFYFPTGMDKRHKALLVQSTAYELQSNDGQSIHEGHDVPHIFIAHSMDLHDSF